MEGLGHGASETVRQCEQRLGLDAHDAFTGRLGLGCGFHRKHDGSKQRRIKSFRHSGLSEPFMRWQFGLRPRNDHRPIADVAEQRPIIKKERLLDRRGFSAREQKLRFHELLARNGF